MPRPGPRREFMGARFTWEQIQAIRDRAAADGVTPSDVIRAAVEWYLQGGK